MMGLWRPWFHTKFFKLCRNSSSSSLKTAIGLKSPSFNFSGENLHTSSPSEVWFSTGGKGSWTIASADFRRILEMHHQWYRNVIDMKFSDVKTKHIFGSQKWINIQKSEQTCYLCFHGPILPTFTFPWRSVSFFKKNVLIFCL